MRPPFQLIVGCQRVKSNEWLTIQRRAACAGTLYRYQIVHCPRLMSALRRHLAKLTETIQLPDVTLSIDIDPVNLA